MATVNSDIHSTLSDCAWLSSRTVYVALSGGIDSIALAHLLHCAKIPFTAIHINHQLHPDADHWQTFCEAFCSSLGIDIITRSVFINGKNNLEAKAREARYEAINAAIESDSIVCFAHHQSDLVETFLLQLKRGSGLNGLTSLRMKRKMEFHNKTWTAYRPLLNVSKNAILHYAETHQLQWVEDPSNATLAHERNIIRHQIIPPLQDHWPDIESRIAHTVDTLRDENTLLNQVCEERLGECLEIDNSLNLEFLAGFSEAWQAQVIRYYCLSHFQLNLSRSQLSELMKLCHSRQDAQGKMLLDGFILRRYQAKLYIAPIDQFSKLQDPSTVKVDLEWQPEPSDTNGGIIHIIKDNVIVPLPEYIDAEHFTEIKCEQVALSHRVKPCLATCTKPLKQWFQSNNVPPWLRQPCYLVEYKNTHIAAICPGVVLVLSDQNTHSMRVTFA